MPTAGNWTDLVILFRLSRLLAVAGLPSGAE